MIPTRQEPVYSNQNWLQELFWPKCIFLCPLFRRYQVGMDCLFHCYHHHHHHHHHPLSKRFTLSAAAIHFLIVFKTATQPQVAVSAPNTRVHPMCARYPCFWFYAMLCLMHYHFYYSSLLLCSSLHYHLLLSSAWFSLLCTAKTLHFTVVFTGFRDFDLF